LRLFPADIKSTYLVQDTKDINRNGTDPVLKTTSKVIGNITALEDYSAVTAVKLIFKGDFVIKPYRSQRSPCVLQ